MAPNLTAAQMDDDLMQLTLQIRNQKDNDKKYASFHGDSLIGNKTVPPVGLWGDLKAIFSAKNLPAIGNIVDGLLLGKGLDGESAAVIGGSLSDYSTRRQQIIDSQVKSKYDRMLHPPLTYLGDAFQYRTADGKFNSVINPHLGQAGAPYAKTVPSKTASLGALPDPGDVFDKLMKREDGGRQSKSGLSSMLIYHATIIIHDIFRTNDNDKNISDSSSYLDLSPLYGYDMDTQRKVRDQTSKLGLLKPDTFAEDRLLRQPPGVCIMLVMYNRYHNYAARQLYKINENGRFSVPDKYKGSMLVALVKNFRPRPSNDPVERKRSNSEFDGECKAYEKALKTFQAAQPKGKKQDSNGGDLHEAAATLRRCEDVLQQHLKDWKVDSASIKKFNDLYDAAWTKLDDDLFNTARLITCGIYIQISVHDYLRALMGFHAYDTNFTLDPRSDFDQKKTTRGIGNQVTVEFNLLYRFHCAISKKDEQYTEDFMKQRYGFKDPANTSLQEFLQTLGRDKAVRQQQGIKDPEPHETEFGIPSDPFSMNQSNPQTFVRNEVTNLFDDAQMLDALTSAMDDPISNFGPRNVPQCMKPVEIMGITQARKWETGTLNDFREFFGMYRHETFESMTKNVDMQNALRDLYEHPDKVELYPGIFCESDEYMGLDPGPKQVSSALWAAIFSDAITLVRSDRFYTVDWNTNSLTSWGMKEVMPDNEVCKSSVFHRLIQRAFPGWLPFNSIRFFHPFYTAEQNAIYAKSQGYETTFTELGPLTLDNAQLPFNAAGVKAKKPEKPVHVNDCVEIALVLSDEHFNFIHPALLHPENLPKKMAEVLGPEGPKFQIGSGKTDKMTEGSELELKDYLKELMRAVTKREAVSMSNSTFQIDATRDFAVPVVTRYVADFLGFGHRLKTESNPHGLFTENEIYQHITNCQTFMSYYTDETKSLKRRTAFKASMAFLFELVRHGNIAEANKWELTKSLFGSRKTNAMEELGLRVARKVLASESDSGKAAAILLLICLDFAYNDVLSFTAVLDEFMRELYATAESRPGDMFLQPQWCTVQDLALSCSDDDAITLQKIITKTSQRAMRLPIVREATQDFVDGPLAVKKGQTVILNIHEALANAEADNKQKEISILLRHLRYVGRFGAYHPWRFAEIAHEAMVKFIAQMRNPRRGHDAQGRLKKITLESISEGYSVFTAPSAMDRIAKQVEHLPGKEGAKIYTDDVLKPEIDTYMTPSWDEMVPFPTTWKIRFDGFGKSDYSTPEHQYGRLRSAWLPDDAPPWYQPQGVSHFGGTFAETVCGCATTAQTAADAPQGDLAKDPSLTPAHLEPTVSVGCSMSHGH